ncbi:uncharacterized protein G6M90_00g030730 [Metarhizium brunneum]|uniref:Uncharacterized protein n=1 Tax=Metarhizium brunneum TaxID=500148 RepID=A0A7D5UWU5_9HYPO|nr:hypothetical protein G6M90_00g030730 [Metarhizium brunneum]
MPAADPNEDLECPSSPLSEANNTSSLEALKQLNETCYEEIWAGYDVKRLDIDINQEGKDAICKDISQEYLRCQGETCGKQVLNSGSQCLRYALKFPQQPQKNTKRPKKDTEQPQKDTEQPQKAAEKSAEKFIDLFSKCFQRGVNGTVIIEAAFSEAVGKFNSCQESRTKCDSELRRSANAYLDSKNLSDDINCHRHVSQSIQECRIFLLYNKPLDGSIEQGFRNCVDNRIDDRMKDKECSVEGQNIEG